MGETEDAFMTKTSSGPYDPKPSNTYKYSTIQNGISVYRAEFTPLEWYLTKERKKQPRCYMKVIVDDSDSRIRGIHYLGPNAGEILQFASLAVRCGATFEELYDTVGIHPTCAEVFTILKDMMAHGPSSAQVKKPEAPVLKEDTKMAVVEQKHEEEVDEACAT